MLFDLVFKTISRDFFFYGLLARMRFLGRALIFLWHSLLFVGRQPSGPGPAAFLRSVPGVRLQGAGSPREKDV